MGYRAQRRRQQHHRGGRGRALVIGILVIATLVVGFWWFLGRGDGAPAGDFVSVEKRFVAAAAAVHETPNVVHRFRELDEFNAALDAQAFVMQQSLEEFNRIAAEEEGDAATIAHSAAAASEEALREVSSFRDAIVTTNDLADAQDALERLDAIVVELDAKVKQWRRL
ncbi:MAG: hypothetical protein WEC34_10775 [Acidimicrobiia bacterium]